MTNYENTRRLIENMNKKMQATGHQLRIGLKDYSEIISATIYDANKKKSHECDINKIEESVDEWLAQSNQ